MKNNRLKISINGEVSSFDEINVRNNTMTLKEAIVLNYIDSIKELISTNLEININEDLVTVISDDKNLEYISLILREDLISYRLENGLRNIHIDIRNVDMFEIPNILDKVFYPIMYNNITIEDIKNMSINMDDITKEGIYSVANELNLPNTIFYYLVDCILTAKIDGKYFPVCNINNNGDNVIFVACRNLIPNESANIIKL